MERIYTEEEKRYQQAQKRVTELRKFYKHLGEFVIANAILAVINLMTSPGYLWFLWCLFGWGIAIAMDAAKVFNVFPFFTKEWEEQKVKEILEKEAKKETKK
ncbi:2TM domain-containing protein [Flavobacterium sp. FlaQc-52]|jgi:ABC-type protease/lipase transport system fused ATPase/permease subunit|uniref:2TM domain-containing protein n=1 Tax=Flavobacterium cupriresistens TaxID=2893885 RepID=A0ABU4RGW2_9FLAO|nr:MULTISPECIES: 2TM domain-containing protein [unclassified Flavobacterium]MDX6191193.1 2TM domain-containing protein [Flavobacterium sp. Fl-318]UFH42488.1 2TM domain-containing protein [Flavobacterium sp. F-323]